MSCFLVNQYYFLKFEDTKRVIRIHMTPPPPPPPPPNNDLQNTTLRTEDSAARKSDVNSGIPEGFTVPASLVTRLAFNCYGNRVGHQYM